MSSAVFFDLDGTFADTAPDLGAALNHLRNLHHLDPMPLQTIRPHASHGSAGLLKLGFNIEPGEPHYSRLRDHFLDYYADHICVHTTLFPGMEELIKTLEQHKLPWGIVTNKPHRFTFPLMQALGYEHRAACLISGDSCLHAKPYPDSLLMACDLLKVRPQDCLYLGDDRRDAEAAQAAGMDFIIARYGYISSPDDLASWPARGGIDLPHQLMHYLID